MIDESEHYQVWSSRKIGHARKEHRCDECHRQVLIGEPYTVYNGLFDGKWQSHPTCQHCMAGPVEWLMQNCRGFCHNAVSDDLIEHFENEDGYPAGDKFRLGRLIVGMGKQWKGWKVPAAGINYDVGRKVTA